MPEITPYKGQVVRLRGPAPVLSHTVRAMYQDRSVYLAPRADGALAIGATYEDVGYDEVVRAAGVADLLARANRVLPCSTSLEFIEANAGLRPGSPDDLPVLGATSRPDVLLATGHYRIGIQLTPATGEVISEALVTGKLPELAKPFSPARFVSAAVAG